MSDKRWRIRTQFVGDDGWTHEARVEGPPTPGFAFVDVVPADAYREAVEALRRIAGQGLGSFDRERRCMMGDSGEPWEHWATIAQRTLEALGQSSSGPGEATG